MATVYTMIALNTVTSKKVSWTSVGAADMTGEFSEYNPADLSGISVDYTTEQDIVPITNDAPKFEVSGDLSGLLPTPTVIGLRGIPISNSPVPSNGDALVYQDGYWTPDAVVAGASSAPFYKTVGPTDSGAEYITDGTDDDVQINQAITDAIAENPQTAIIQLLPGIYSISAPIELKSNIVLQGSGTGVTKIVVSTSFVETNYYAIGALGVETTGTAILLTSDGYQGLQVLSCAASAELSAVDIEDFLFLLSDGYWENSTNPPAPFTPISNRKRGEYVKVLAKDSSGPNTLDIYGMVRDNYTTTDNAALYRMSFIENCGVKDLEIYQEGAENSRTGNIPPMISFHKVNNGFVKNVHIHHNDGPGITVHQSVGVRITDCYIHDLTNNTAVSHLGYGCLIGGASENVTVSGCTISRVRHGIDSGPSRTPTTATSGYGVPRGITITNNVVTHATNAAYSTHNEAENWSFVGNVASNGLSFGMYMRGRGCSIIGNTIEWCGGGIGVGDPIFSSSSGSASGSRIIGNSIRHIKRQPSILSSYASQGTTSSTYAVGEGIILGLTDNSTIMNNVISDCDSCGIRLRLSAIRNIVKGNTILNCNLRNATANSSEAITIDGNSSGASASITFDGVSVCTLTRVGANFNAAHAGRVITITDASTPSNNGSFIITSVTSTTDITYTNVSGATDANNGSISYWIEGSTDNIFEHNFAANTTSQYDRDVTGHMKHMIRDYGASGNIRNTYRNNTAFGMETGLLIVNANSFQSGNSTTESTPIKILSAAPDDSNFAHTPETGTTAFNTSKNATYVRTSSTNTWKRTDFSINNQWDIDATSVRINQEDQTANSTNGQSLTVRAQNATGTTSTGGSLILAPGSGTSGNGTIRLSDPSGTNTIQITPNPTGTSSITAVAGVTAFNITQTATSVASGAALQIVAQATSLDASTGGLVGLSAGNATGTSGTGGGVFISSGTGNTNNGSINFRTGSTTFFTFLSPDPSGTVNGQFVSTVTAANILQASNSNSSITGAPFKIQAQNATGTTSIGGDLLLTSGTGTTTAGQVRVQAGGTDKILVSSTDTQLANNTLTFVSTAATPTITQADETGNSVAGDNLVIRAQSSTGTTTTGGSIVLRPGSGTSTHGSIRMFDPGTNALSVDFVPRSAGASTITFVPGVTGVTISQNPTSSSSGATFQITSQSTSLDASTGGIAGLSAGSATGTTGTGGAINISSGTGNTNNGSINFRTGSTTFFTFLTPNPTGTVNAQFVSTPTAVNILQASNSNASITGSPLKLQAQNATGTTSTGGNLLLTSGTGTTAAGQVKIQTGGTDRITVDPTGVQIGNGSLDLGSGTGVIGIDNASVNPSSNPTNGIVAYVDAGDGYLKYRKADGNVISLNGAGGGSFTAGGDLSGSSSSQTVIGIQSKSVSSSSPVHGNVLQYSSTSNQWRPTDTTAASTWETVYEVDFSSLPTQSFSGNGDVTIDGKTWTVENFGNASSMGVVNGTGLRIACNTTSSDYVNSTRTAPLIKSKIKQLFPAFDMSHHKVRISLYFTHNADENFENTVAAIEDANSPMALSYAVLKGTTGNGWQSRITQANTSTTNGSDTANITTDNVIQMTFYSPTEVEARTGAYSGGFPSQDSTNSRRKWTVTSTQLSYANSDDIAFAFAALTFNSSGNFVSSAIKMKVEVLRPTLLVAADPGWSTVYDVDMTALTSQSFSGNGNVTIDNRTWTVENFANATSFGIVNTEGLKFVCNTNSTDYINSTRTALLIKTKIKSFIPNFDISSTKFRVTCYMIDNVDQNFENFIMALEDADAPTQLNYTIQRGFASTQGNAYISTRRTVAASSTDIVQNTNTTDNVLQITFNSIGSVEFKSGVYSGGFPSQDALRMRAIQSVTNIDPAMEHSDDIYLTFAAGTSNSAGNLICKIARLKVEVLNGPVVVSPSGYNTFSNRPTAGIMGRRFLSSDGPIEFVDTGSEWKPIINGKTGKEVPAESNFTLVTANGLTNASTLLKEYGVLKFVWTGNGSTGSAEPLRLAYKAAPTSGATGYRVTAHLTFMSPTQNGGTFSLLGGLGWRNSSTGNVELMEWAHQSTGVSRPSRRRYTASGTGTTPTFTFSAQTIGAADTTRNDVWLRIERTTAGARDFYVSYNGTHWHKITATGFPSTGNEFFTPDQIFIESCIFGESGGNAGSLCGVIFNSYEEEAF